MTSWVPRSQRQGHNNYDGPFEGVPDHLRGPLTSWLRETLDDEGARTLAVRLRMSLSIGYYGAVHALVDLVADDADLLLDTVEGTLQSADTFSRYQLTEAVERLLSLGGSAYAVGSDGLIVERVNPQMKEVHDSATQHRDSVSEHLRQAWLKAYGRDPDSADAWDHSIKALEAALHHHVSPNNERATLGSIINALQDAPQKYEMVLRGPQRDYDPRPLTQTLRMIWPDPNRHGMAEPGPEATLEEARAVVNLTAALIQSHRDHPLIRRRD